MKPRHSPETISVLYDDRGFKMEYGGVSRYYTELVRHFPDDVHWRIAVRRTCNRYLLQEPFSVPAMRREYTGDDFTRDVLHGRRIRGIHRLFRLLRRVSPELVHADKLANERHVKRLSRRRCIDLVHLTEPHFFGYDWKRVVGNKPFVTTVVDLIPELLQGRDFIRPHRKAVLDAASGIVAISQFTKDQIVEQYGVPEAKIRVIHLGPDPIGTASGDSPIRFGRYILYVGRRREIADYKNFPFFVRAIAPILKERRDVFLVCTGSPFEDCDRKLFAENGMSDKAIHFVADDRSLTNLFSHAAAFVYPSKMEGFGIPVLDAFAARCPVVLSNSSCFPEIAGDAAIYFDIGDAAGLRQAVQTAMDDNDVRANLIAKGVRRMKMFSWEKCAAETAEFYREVLSRKP